jgi:hypothetical protein
LSANAIVDPTVFDIFKTFGHRAPGNNMTKDTPSIADTTVLDLFKAFGHKALVNNVTADTPSIADATVLDLFEAFGHSADLVSEPSNPINVNKCPSQSIQDHAEVVCKRMRLAPLSVQKVYEFIGVSSLPSHLSPLSHYFLFSSHLKNNI